jgi:hypothetical protein
MVYNYYLYRVFQIHIMFNKHPKTDQTVGNGKEKNKFTKIIQVLLHLMFNLRQQKYYGSDVISR